MLTASLISALLMGLIGSTHCIGMCGGIISTLSTNFTAEGDITPKVRPIYIQLFYNLGRISSYTFIGFLVGIFSSQLMELLPDPHTFSMKISGLFFILLGLYISQLFNSFKYLERFGQKLWIKIEPLGRNYLPARSLPAALKLGLVWGWLPCGLVYSALALALTQLNPIHSALTMLIFGLGTLPTLLLIGHFAQNVKSILQNKWVRTGLGVFLVSYGLFQITGQSGMMYH